MIPEILHIIRSVDRGGIATDEIRWEKSRAIGFPGWSPVEWSGRDLEGLMKEAICKDLLLSDKLTQPARHLLLHYEVLRMAGGVISFPDIEFFRGIDGLVLEDCLHLNFQKGRSLSNGLIVSPRAFPFWDFFLRRVRACIEDVGRNRRALDWWIGRRAISEAVRMWLNDNWSSQEITDPEGGVVGGLYGHADLVIWNREVAFPYEMSEEGISASSNDDHLHSYAMCHWKSSMHFV